eukprot:SAG31_NODE_39493_length_287_cov_3.058511_2_plen_44_part_01
MLIGTPPNLVLAASWTSQLDAVSVLLILLIYNRYQFGTTTNLQ